MAGLPVAPSKDGNIGKQLAYQRDIAAWNAQANSKKPPIDPGYGETGLEGNKLPYVPIKQWFDAPVGTFTGEHADLMAGLKATGAPAKATNYADAFDPSGSQYSVNTGNASVRQLEDLKSVLSTEPVSVAQDNTFLVPMGVLALIFLI